MTVPLVASLASAVHEAERRLAAAGVPSPRHDAEALAALALHRPRRALAAAMLTDDGFAEDAYGEFTRLVDRRAAREPLQHITGVVGFRYLDLAVGPGVFVPRPETELVAGTAVAAARAVAAAGNPWPLVVDLCAGSGAIALAVAQEVPGAVVHAVECDPLAHSWALRNVRAYALPVSVHLADATSALDELDARVDVVVSNPPYVPDGTDVSAEVLRDPAAALWGGPDGLDTIRAIARRAAELARPGATFVLEHDSSHQPDVVALLADSGAWTDIAPYDDLAGRPRFVTAHRAGPVA